jgi:glycosyltransferase involved in cell wall biosynthesis
VLRDVVLTGHLTGADLARAVASADIMLHPSVTETFGNVILEAMASGVAMIAADAPNSRALIEPDRTGLLVAPANAGAYAAAAGRLIDSPEERRRIGAAALRAAQAYTWDGVCAEVEAAYFKVLAR